MEKGIMYYIWCKGTTQVKGKVFRTTARPVILYMTQSWAINNHQETKVSVTEIRMLRWMCDKTRHDKSINENIVESVGVTPIILKMVKNRHRWFGNVERRPIDSAVRKVYQMERRKTIWGRGRPKNTIREVIKKCREINDLDRSMILYRILWRGLTHVADPT